jgi:secreted trypsin-like serine protease
MLTLLAPLLLTAVLAGAAAARTTPVRLVAEHPAIINGTATTSDSYSSRWSAIAAVLGSTSWGETLCGGALIDERTVVTAAHCTYGPTGGTLSPSSIEVVVGRRVATSGDGDRIDVASVTRHPSFDRTTMRNDIAVLRLARSPAVAVGYLTPTSAADQAWWGGGLGLERGTDSVGPWIAGWGATDAVHGTVPAELHEAKVPIASDDSCARGAAPGHGTNFDRQSMVCAGLPGTTTGSGVDACQGDSGGPLIAGDGAGAWRLVGLTSWGLDCGGAYYGAYTRVGHYVSWLEPLRYVPSATPLQPITPPLAPVPPTPAPAPGPTPTPVPGGPDGQPAPGDGSGEVPTAGGSIGPAPATSAVGPLQLSGSPAGRSPTRPTMLRVAPLRRGWIRLSWRASRDDGRIAAYRILARGTRGWRVLRTVRSTRATVRLATGRRHAIRVQAVDDSGRRSALSVAVVARVR